MTCLDQTVKQKIKISDFISPSLFWYLLEDETSDRKLFIDKLQQSMRRYKICEEPEIDQIVAIKYNKAWARAEVKDIQKGIDSNFILVVICDEGVCKKVNLVYNLPKDLAAVPPFAKKGMLYGVQSTKAHFDYNLGKSCVQPCEFWSSGSIEKIKEIFNEPFVILHFVKRLSFNKTNIGNLFVTRGREPTYNLVDFLVKQGCAIFDEVAFKLELLFDTSAAVTVRTILTELRGESPILIKPDTEPYNAIGENDIRYIQKMSQNNFDSDLTENRRSSFSQTSNRLRSKSEVRFKEPEKEYIEEVKTSKDTFQKKTYDHRTIKRERQRILERAGYTKNKPENMNSQFDMKSQHKSRYSDPVTRNRNESNLHDTRNNENDEKKPVGLQRSKSGFDLKQYQDNFDKKLNSKFSDVYQNKNEQNVQGFQKNKSNESKTPVENNTKKDKTSGRRSFDDDKFQSKHEKKNFTGRAKGYFKKKENLATGVEMPHCMNSECFEDAKNDKIDDNNVVTPRSREYSIKNKSAHVNNRQNYDTFSDSPKYSNKNEFKSSGRGFSKSRKSAGRMSDSDSISDISEINSSRRSGDFDDVEKNLNTSKEVKANRNSLSNESFSSIQGVSCKLPNRRFDPNNSANNSDDSQLKINRVELEISPNMHLNESGRGRGRGKFSSSKKSGFSISDKFQQLEIKKHDKFDDSELNFDEFEQDKYNKSLNDSQKDTGRGRGKLIHKTRDSDPIESKNPNLEDLNTNMYSKAEKFANIKRTIKNEYCPASFNIIRTIKNEYCERDISAYVEKSKPEPITKNVDVSPSIKLSDRFTNPGCGVNREENLMSKTDKRNSNTFGTKSNLSRGRGFNREEEFMSDSENQDYSFEKKSKSNRGRGMSHNKNVMSGSSEQESNAFGAKPKSNYGYGFNRDENFISDSEKLDNSFEEKRKSSRGRGFSYNEDLMSDSEKPNTSFGKESTSNINRGFSHKEDLMSDNSFEKRPMESHDRSFSCKEELNSELDIDAFEEIPKLSRGRGFRPKESLVSDSEQLDTRSNTSEVKSRQSHGRGFFRIGDVMSDSEKSDITSPTDEDTMHKVKKEPFKNESLSFGRGFSRSHKSNSTISDSDSLSDNSKQYSKASDHPLKKDKTAKYKITKNYKTRSIVSDSESLSESVDNSKQIVRKDDEFCEKINKETLLSTKNSFGNEKNSKSSKYSTKSDTDSISDISKQYSKNVDQKLSKMSQSAKFEIETFSLGRGYSKSRKSDNKISDSDSISDNSSHISKVPDELNEKICTDTIHSTTKDSFKKEKLLDYDFSKSGRSENKISDSDSISNNSKCITEKFDDKKLSKNTSATNSFMKETISPSSSKLHNSDSMVSESDNSLSDKSKTPKVKDKVENSSSGDNSLKNESICVGRGLSRRSKCKKMFNDDLNSSFTSVEESVNQQNDLKELNTKNDSEYSTVFTDLSEENKNVIIDCKPAGYSLNTVSKSNKADKYNRDEANFLGCSDSSSNNGIDNKIKPKYQVKSEDCYINNDDFLEITDDIKPSNYKYEQDLNCISKKVNLDVEEKIEKEECSTNNKLEENIVSDKQEKYISQNNQSNHNPNKDTDFHSQNKQKAPQCTVQIGHCLCETCSSWRNTNEPVFAPRNINTTPEKQSTRKIILKPEVLLKTSISDEKIIIHKKHYENSAEEFNAPKVLVHGAAIPDPVFTLKEARFHPNILQAMMNLKYERAHRIQAYTWPSIIRGQHTVIVNIAKSGKTMAYIPAICSNVLCFEDAQLGNSSVGPLALILVPGVQVAEDVSCLICKLYQKTRFKPKILLAVPPLISRVKSDISKGVDILICTPKILLKLLKEKDTKLRRICWVVFENANELFDKFPEEIESILQLLQNILLKRTCGTTIQLITVSQYWTKPIEKLVKRLKIMPTICIGAYIEAALYGRVDIQIQFLESKKKAKLIKETIIVKNTKTIIICNTNEQVEEVCQWLEKIKPLSLDDNSTIDDHTRIQNQWNADFNGEYLILVCTDQILRTSVFVNIFDAQIVVQYALPDSWTRFAQRFSLFLEHHSGPLVKFANETEIPCKMRIFVDEENTTQFGKMVGLLLRMEVPLSESLVEAYGTIMNKKENNKLTSEVDLCHNMKLFGECSEIDSCKERHLVDPVLDITNRIPQSGIIKLKILHMYDITSFSARLIQHIDSESVTHDIKDKFGEIAVKLTKLTNEKNRKSVFDVDIGTICAVEETASLFRRCKVIKILTRGTLNQPNKVKVKLLDLGATKDVTVYELYRLPEKELEDIPPQAVNIYLADMGPPEKDTNWSDCARIRLNKMLKIAGYENPNCYFSGRILLQLGNSLWVNNLILREYAPDGSLHVHKLSARSALLKNDLAEDRPGQLDGLYNLCAQKNIKLPDYNLPIIKPPTKEIPFQVKPMWAHLDNFVEYNTVYFSSANNPSQFFIRICKHQTIFDKLVDEIQAAIKGPLYPTEFDVIEGRCYLAKDPLSEQYARVIVLKLTDDIAECFFVDHGDYVTVNKSELKFLTDELISRVPFQVIECELWGIRPKDGAWCDEATDLLYKYAYEPDSDLLRYLYVKVIDKDIANITGGRRYGIILIDSIQENTIINNVFVNNNLATKVRGENLDQVDFEKLNPKTDESQSLEEYNDSDKEYTEAEIKEMSKKYYSKQTNVDIADKGTSSNFSSTEAPIEEIKRDSSHSSEVSFDIQIKDFFSFITDGIRKPNSAPFISTPKTTQSEPRSNLAALTTPDFSTPDVIWSQNETHVILKIKIVGVTDYELTISRNKFLFFSTTTRNIVYKLNIGLFAKIDSSVEHQAKGLFVYAKLKKSSATEWERLVSTRQHLRNITYDTENIQEKQVVEEKTHIPFLFDDEDKPGFIYEYGSDFDYDSSDVESYDSEDS